jgi:hypothetical protein
MSVIRNGRYFRLIPYPESEQTSVMKHIMSWTTEDDLDDTYENLMNELDNNGQLNIENIRLNYKFINEILLEFNYNISNITSIYRKYKDIEKSYIQGLIKYIKENKETPQNFDIIKKVFITYADLIIYIYYNYFTTFISLANYLQQNRLYYNVQELVLYRGFNYNRYKLLLNAVEKINIGETFNTSCFLSTSIYKNTAIKFIPPNNEIKIIWKINIKPDKYHNIYYSYLSNSHYDFIDFNDNSGKEVEFLLNINAKLQLINKYYNNNLLYYEWNFIEYEMLNETYFTDFKCYINQIFDFINVKTLK